MRNVEKSYWQEIHDAPADEDVCVCVYDEYVGSDRQTICGQGFKLEAHA